MKVPTVNIKPRKGKKGTTWHVDYMDPNGNRIRYSLGNISKPEAIEKKRANLERTKRTDPWYRNWTQKEYRIKGFI